MKLVLPLVGVETVSSLTGYSVRRVMQMIECGELRLAFDLSMGSSRQFIRIWRGCLTAFLERRPQPDSLPDALADVLPASKTIHASVLRARLNISYDQCCDLVHKAGWKVLTHGLRGVNGSAVLQRDSVATWLLSRRIGGSSKMPQDGLEGIKTPSARSSALAVTAMRCGSPLHKR